MENKDISMDISTQMKQRMLSFVKIFAKIDIHVMLLSDVLLRIALAIVELLVKQNSFAFPIAV